MYIINGSIGLIEGSEGNSVLQFVEHLLRAELFLPSDPALNIQRAHKALTPKPGPGETFILSYTHLLPVS